jgi:hypothetical protein
MTVIAPARFTSLAALSAAFCGVPSAQSFVLNTTDVPQTVNDTEQIDFADVDLDGDWDCALANGGDHPPQQNQLWINQGGLQPGTVGTFLDETAARFPAVADPSRDLEFADVDGDADHDLYVVRHAQIVNAGSRWWINQGGEQGGTIGVFQDETAARWVGLGGPGSSIHPSLLLPGGGWVDWSGDADFADLDGDGDLDLVHSSYGGAYGGQVPTRLFLNDGDGNFAEFNPSGFQLSGPNIQTGDPALWCMGTQLHGTSDVTGTNADVADSIVDLEVADVDGDLDCDVLWGPLFQGKPRLFRNLLDQGALGFRDESALAFPGITLSAFVYEQELGDLDADGDLDLYGLSWDDTLFFSFDDLVYENQGGVYGNPVLLPSSGADEEEADFLDFDADGDLDVYVANFSGQDRLYENLGTTPMSFAHVTATELPSGLTAIGRDAEVADVDLDGDYDVMVANGSSLLLNYYLENVTDVPDAAAPWISLVESVSVPAATDGALRVRAQVYDNAPLYTVRYQPTVLEVAVDGVPLPPAPMSWGGGQVFRGELPANLIGSVQYRVRSTDGVGNAGFSSVQGYTATGDEGTSYGTASAATGATPPTLQVLAEVRAGATAVLTGGGLASAPCLLGTATASLAPTAVPGLPNLVLNVDPSTLIVTAQSVSDAAGHGMFALPIPGGLTGIQVFAQYLELAPDLTFGSSQGLQLTIQ